MEWWEAGGWGAGLAEAAERLLRGRRVRVMVRVRVRFRVKVKVRARARARVKVKVRGRVLGLPWISPGATRGWWGGEGELPDLHAAPCPCPCAYNQNPGSSAPTTSAQRTPPNQIRTGASSLVALAGAASSADNIPRRRPPLEPPLTSRFRTEGLQQNSDCRAVTRFSTMCMCMCMCNVRMCVCAGAYACACAGAMCA